jgi:hypothetical protein
MNNPIVMGNYGGGSFNFSDTRNNSTGNGFLNDYGQASDDIFYRFTFLAAGSITISHCGSGFDTYMYLLDGGGAMITYNDDYGPACSGTAASISTTLAAGTYYIVSEGYYTYTGNITTSVTMTVQTPPAPLDTRNFVKAWDALALETDPNILMTRGVKDVRHTASYFDGLGRAEQTVIKGGAYDIWSGQAATDIVSINEYDAFGREAKKYLPYVSSSSDGLYKTIAATDQLSFNQGWFSSQGESNFYGLTEFEASPLNRITKSMAPGVNWVGAPNGGRGVSAQYLVNTTADEVRAWTVTDVGGDFGTYSSTLYDAGTLYKNVTTDEHGKQVVEYKDKEGQVVLKKVQIADAPGANHTGWLCTYYIYDDLGQLRAVLQPKAVEALDPASALSQGLNWSLNNAILDELVFRYEHDGRGRMAMKKVPGAGAVYMVYDKRDRLVMTQDANLSQQGQWMVTLYDNLNRPTETGLWTNGNGLSYHATPASISTAYPFASNSVPGSGYENQSRTFYDNYNWIANYGYLISGSRVSTYDSYLQPASSGFPYTQASTNQSTDTGFGDWYFEQNYWYPKFIEYINYI